MTRRNDKRTRLVEAADQLFHKQGVNTTTLANIAQLSEVPLGNVYYYFKSKESIVLAVIEYRRRILQQQFEELNTLPAGKERLVSLIKSFVQANEETANYGDALGSLCQELAKQGGTITEAATELMHDVIRWCEKQFSALGKADDAKKLASSFVASLQGMSLLTLSLRDPSFTSNQSDYLIDWVETV